MNEQRTKEFLTILGKSVRVYEQYYGHDITVQFEVEDEWAGTIPARISQNRGGERDKYIAEIITMEGL